MTSWVPWFLIALAEAIFGFALAVMNLKLLRRVDGLIAWKRAVLQWIDPKRRPHLEAYAKALVEKDFTYKELN